MITAETIRQAKQNIEEQNAKKYYNSKPTFHFKSFSIGLAIGLIVCGILLSIYF